MGSGANTCHRRQPRYKDHVWSYDFVSEQTERGGQIQMLNVVDEFTRECLTIEVRRHFRGQNVVAAAMREYRSSGVLPAR